KERKPNCRTDCNNNYLGQGIPSLANTQGNSTPNPWVPGYPLNYVVFLNNFSEETNEMMLSMLLNQLLVSRKQAEAARAALQGFRITLSQTTKTTYVKK
ncbi:hypothetical protein EI555_015540, partial [Monodon monoceros]